jgi:nucleotide-binding universal stress UspA family protein
MVAPLGFRRLLVPLGDNVESERAVDTACRLASEHGASITAVRAVEIASLLPLDAHMTEEEDQAHRLLDRAAAIAELYGLKVSTCVPHTRDAAAAIVNQAAAEAIELIVIGAPRKAGASRGTAVFGGTVEHVLKKAPCRVMVIGAARESLRLARPAAA